MMMKRRGALCALLLAVLSACGTDDEAGQVRGHVTTEGGAALAGVHVRVDGTDAVATSDAQGDFTLWNVKPGGRMLVASHADYADSSKSVTVKRLSLKQSSSKLTGLVHHRNMTSVAHQSQRQQ